VRSFFTSSLDKIDPPAPFVNAMQWDSFRSQFQSPQSLDSGNRNCAQASISLNPESTELTNRSNPRQDFPLIVQNTFGRHVTIEIQPGPQSLAAGDVDACFGDGCIDFLNEKTASSARTSWLETPFIACEDTHDQELGLLESVQEIAIALARTTPTRVMPGKKDAEHWTTF
jgi:hypothetical protein